MTARMRAVAASLLTTLLIGQAAFAQTQPAPSAPQYEIYALRYAHIPDFSVASLIAGADRDRKLDIAMMVWLIKGNGRVILFDSGFYRDKFMQQWKPQDYVRPDQLIARVGLKPEDVTDLVISHMHWDHADGADLFPKARVWVQREEYQYYTADAWQPTEPMPSDTAEAQRAARADRNKHGGIDADDVLALTKIATEGRLRLVNGDDQEILPGIRAYIGGKHTYQSQFITVPTRGGTAVLASDNAYLYENFDKHVPIAQTLDAASNLRAQDRMKQLASKPKLIVPGHDPAVMERYPKIADGVVRVD